MKHWTRVLVLCSVLAANIVVPHLHSAGSTGPNACCKYCGAGGDGIETTRDASCAITCHVTLCNTELEESPNCAGGVYSCDGAWNDDCIDWVDC